MEISTDEQQHTSGLKKPGTSSVVLHVMASIVKWVVGLFSLTEEEKDQAGIYLDKYGHDA